MFKAIPVACLGSLLCLAILACQPTNQTRPTPASTVKPTALPQPGLLASAQPTASVTVPSPQATPLTSATTLPSAQNTPSPASSQTPIMLPAEVSPDSALRQEIVKKLARLMPELTESPSVTALTRQHALQIAMNPKDTAFKVQANYDPVAPSGLQTQILKQGIFPSDNLLSAYFSDSNRERLLQRFQQQVSDSVGVLPYTHFGVEVLRKDSAWVVSVV
ncbi:MAG: hypothetical protein AB7I41_25365, partial [Candidatus Sericytochromatia bacterium]